MSVCPGLAAAGLMSLSPRAGSSSLLEEEPGCVVVVPPRLSLSAHPAFE